MVKKIQGAHSFSLNAFFKVKLNFLISEMPLVVTTHVCLEMPDKSGLSSYLTVPSVSRIKLPVPTRVVLEDWKLGNLPS